MKKDITPKSADEWHDLALSHFHKNEYDKAIEYYKNALENDPEYTNSWHGLGVSYERKKEYDKAIEYYKKTLEIDPEYVHSWFGLAGSYFQKKEYDKAIEYDKKTLEIDPEYANSWFGLGESYFKKKEYDKAIESNMKGLELNQEFPKAWQTLGASYYNKNEYDKAIKSYNNGLEINPEMEGAWYGLGASYHAKKKYPKAIECYKKALEINQEFEIAWKSLSLAYNAVSDFKNAEKARNHEIDLISHLKKEISIKELIGSSHFDSKNIKVERGGDWKVEGNQSIFLFKTKITNNSDFVITNIQILLTSLPSGLEASVDRLKISFLRPSAHESPEFKLKAKKSCVGDYIEGIVTFMDPSGKQLTKGIDPLEINYVCSLLIPKLISKQEFDNKTKFMEKKGITVESDLSASELENVIQRIVTECNFALTQELKENREEDFRIFEGYAQGMYDKQDVALSILVRDFEKGSKVVVNAMSKVSAKNIDLLKECSIKLDEIKSDTQLIKEYSSQIGDIFEKLEKLDDIENYLQQKLASDWDKIKDTWQRYKSKEIDLMEFLKDGTKIVGKRFIKKILGNYI
ncbi:MAG: tetratricopeptide repeat protein [Promethearchaeota archaeon]